VHPATQAAGNVKTLRAGAELGLWTALGFAFQSVGLLTTTASRSAFLLYLNVKIVPFLAWALLGRQVAASTWASALLALTGTALLSTDGGPVTVGDAWSVAAATASAMFILRLEAFAREHDAAQLNGVAFATVTALCAVWVGADLVVADQQQQQGFATLQPADLLGTVLANPWPILYLGAFSTGLCNFLQTLGQRDIAAERAAIIYSMDPVYGAMFSYLFLHEGLGPQGFAGAAFVLLGVALSAMTTKTTEVPGNVTAEAAAAAAALPTIVVVNAAIDNDGAQQL
jgi:drug/metabolite transporter (DMT)-like permease